MKDKLGAKRDEACALRFHASQGAVGLNLTRSLPEANIARCTLAGLAGVLSGAQSVGIRTMDEAYGIPSAKASLISLRTLQIIAEETGVTNTVDPLAGSYLVEWLTDEVERRINVYLARIEALGGMVSAIKAGYVQGEIARSAFDYERDLEEKRKITVGMNLTSIRWRRSADTPVTSSTRPCRRSRSDTWRSSRAGGTMSASPPLCRRSARPQHDRRETTTT